MGRYALERKRFVLGIASGLLGITILVSLLAFIWLGEQRLNRTYIVPDEAISLPADQYALSEGRRIFQYRGCEACHGEQLQGLVYLDNPAIGQVITPNLTSGAGGIASQRSDRDWVRAIRHGVSQDGTPLLFMPSTEFYYLSDQDLGRVIAYIKSVPPVDNEMPSSELSLTGRIVMNITQAITFLPAELIPHDDPRPITPEPAVSPEYGEYLALSCKVCHGLTLSGGEITGFPPEWPPAPNLTPGAGSRLPSWGESGFIEIIRTGQKHGRAINADYMPWESYRHMNEDELKAVYAYLASLPARDFGEH
jgi:mono/diheme cytochrome c family protein